MLSKLLLQMNVRLSLSRRTHRNQISQKSQVIRSWRLEMKIISLTNLAHQKMMILI